MVDVELKYFTYAFTASRAAVKMPGTGPLMSATLPGVRVKATGRPIDSSHPDDDYAALAGKLLGKPHFEGKLTVVCWHHEKIPHFAKALGAREGDTPQPWDPDVFNRILQFSFKAGKLTVQQIEEPF